MEVFGRVLNLGAALGWCYSFVATKLVCCKHGPKLRHILPDASSLKEPLARTRYCVPLNASSFYTYASMPAWVHVHACLRKRVGARARRLVIVIVIVIDIVIVIVIVILIVTALVTILAVITSVRVEVLKQQRPPAEARQVLHLSRRHTNYYYTNIIVMVCISSRFLLLLLLLLVLLLRLE